MAVDTTDGCLPSKMSPPEDMEVGSEGQESYGPVSQEASSRGALPGSAGDSQSQIQSSQEVMILYPVTKVIQGRSSELAAYIKCSNYHNS